MDAGALGAEIVISGKLRTERARFEKFRAGYLPKSGEPPLRYLRTAEVHVQLKVGILGVKVKILPPDAQFPDKVEILENVPKLEEPKPSEEVKTETQEQPEKVPDEKVEEKKIEEKPQEEPTEKPQEKPAEPEKPKKKPEKKTRKTKKEKPPKKTVKEK